VEDSWEVPLTPRYAAEEPSTGRKGEGEDEPCARWLPEMPPTSCSEGKWFANKDRDSDGGAPVATPPWRPARPPTPRYFEPEQPIAQPQPEQSTAHPQPQPHVDAAHQTQAEEQTVERTEVPAAHVSHSTRAFVVEGVRCRQQMVVWTWPEEPVTEATREEPRIWEEGVPKLSPRDPRTRGRQDAWVTPIPSTGPPTPATTVPTGEAKSLENGPWAWPEPPATQRPPLQRQNLTSGVTRPRRRKAVDARSLVESGQRGSRKHPRSRRHGGRVAGVASWSPKADGDTG